LNYTINYSEEVVSDGENNIRSWYHIQLDEGHGDKIEFTNYKNMLSINVHAKLSDTVGMMGTSGKPGLIGRDGTTIQVDPNEMGSQWQVQPDDPILFHTMRAPQYPEACITPTVATVEQSRRRLRSDGFTQQAQEACKYVSKNLQEFCVQDIIMSGDISLAHTYIGGVF
jgi:hypothetical protein